MGYGTVELNPGSGGNEIAVDTVGGDDFQRVKFAHGAEGAATDTSESAPLPVIEAQGSTGTFSSANGTSNAVILVAGARVNAKFFNDDPAADFLIAEGFSSSATDFTFRISPRTLYVTDFKGAISGMYASSPTSTLKITAVTI